MPLFCEKCLESTVKWQNYFGNFFDSNWDRSKRLWLIQGTKSFLISITENDTTHLFLYWKSIYVSTTMGINIEQTSLFAPQKLKTPDCILSAEMITFFLMVTVLFLSENNIVERMYTRHFLVKSMLMEFISGFIEKCMCWHVSFWTQYQIKSKPWRYAVNPCSVYLDVLYYHILISMINILFICIKLFKRKKWWTTESILWVGNYY